MRRFAGLESQPERVRPLPSEHAAAKTGATIFPNRVYDAAQSPRVLVSGRNSRKLGAIVTKGFWKGMPIYQISLEERATCPRDCVNWLVCYGNSSPFVRRHRPGPDLENAIEKELVELQNKYPSGFVVRLHNLGDFYSVAYVQKWTNWLHEFPALRIFGYTAWKCHTPVGAAIQKVRNRFGRRFSIRISGLATVTIWRKPEGRVVKEGIVCPAELDLNRCCGTCTLCWAAPGKVVVFVGHGNTSQGGGVSPEETAALNADILHAWNAGPTSMQRLANKMGIRRARVAKVIGPAFRDGTANLYTQNSGRSRGTHDIR